MFMRIHFWLKTENKIGYISFYILVKGRFFRLSQKQKERKKERMVFPFLCFMTRPGVL